MSIYADVSWKEKYVSHALNRKFAGIMPVGVYSGFSCAVDAAGLVTVGVTGTDNTAIAEVGGYSVTIRMTEPMTVAATAADPVIVLAPYYVVGAPTHVAIKAVSAPESHHLVLCRVTPAAETDSGQPEIDAASLAQSPAWTHGGSIDEETLARMASAQVETMDRQVAQHSRIYALEQAGV